MNTPADPNHELSATGDRPLCGADAAVVDAARRSAPLPVTCPACLRLLANDARTAAHVARPRADESED